MTQYIHAQIVIKDGEAEYEKHLIFETEETDPTHAIDQRICRLFGTDEDEMLGSKSTLSFSDYYEYPHDEYRIAKLGSFSLLPQAHYEILKQYIDS